MSTNTPKSTTLRTVPVSVMPGFRSLISSTSVRSTGGGQLIARVAARASSAPARCPAAWARRCRSCCGSLLLAEELQLLRQPMPDLPAAHVRERIAAERRAAPAPRRSSPDGRRCGRAPLHSPERAESLRTARYALGPSFGTFSSCLPLGKCAVLLPVGDDVLRHGRRVDARDACRAERAEAVFRSTPTALTQSSTTPESASSSRFCGHVVLILPHADGLGVDLHQLRQRILQPPGDGDGAAQVHVIIWGTPPPPAWLAE